MSRSRPGSARPERHGSADRPLPVPRRGSTETENFTTECKAAYLAVFDDLSADIESKQELCKGIYLCYRFTLKFHSRP